MRLLRLACAFVLLGCAAPVLAAMQADTVEWTIGDTTFRGVLVHDDANPEPRPGLVMVPNWMGVTASAVGKAKEMAGTDYVVLVADMYGKDTRPADSQEAGVVSGALRGDRALLRERIGKAVEVLRAQAGRVPLDAARIAAVGFCFGGTTVLELARSGSDVAAVVSLHGGLTTPMPAATGAVQAPVLVLNGADDQGVSAADIAGFQEEMDDAGADWSFVNFSGAVHCFAEADADSPPNCVYNERAARRAYRILGGFLREQFAASP